MKPDDRRRKLRVMARRALAVTTPDRHDLRVSVDWDRDDPRNIDKVTYRLTMPGRAPLDIPMKKVTDKALVLTLLELLDERIRRGALAEQVAEIELGIDDRRADGRREAAKTIAKKHPKDSALKREALQMYADKPRSARAIAEAMCARRKNLVFETLRKDVAKWIKDAKNSG